MSTILFPAGLTIKFTNLNMEEMEFYARSWNLKRIQMEKGLFTGSMSIAHTPRIQLLRSPYSHGILLQGDFPKGTVLIGALVTKADVIFQNKLLNQHIIKILRDGDQIDFLCSGKNETFTLAVEESFFDAAYHAYFGQEFYVSEKKMQIHINPQFFPYFIQGIEKWISFLMKSDNHIRIQKKYEQIELEILAHIFSCIYFEDDKKYRQKFQVKKARDLLHESIGGENNMISLAKELGVSERLLYYSFKKNYGITPKRYLLGLRMHNVKQDLLVADPKETIASIIQKHNFYNQSTFTQAYKEMFGELPSNIIKNNL